MIASLRQELHLTRAQEAAYLRAMVAYMPEHYTDSQLQRLVRCYHFDHQEVLALRDPNHAGYQAAWEHWRTQVTRILRSARLDWLADDAIELEDLTQIALAELNESIANY